MANFLYARNLHSHLLLALQNVVEAKTSIKFLEGRSKRAEIKTTLPIIRKSDYKLKFSGLAREQGELFDGQSKHCNVLLDQGGLPLAICTARKWLITDLALPKIWWFKSAHASGKGGTNWPLILTIISILLVSKLIYFR